MLGCRSVTVGRTAPVGSLDVVRRSGGTVTVEGWAVDRDTYDPAQIHVYVEGRGSAVSTGRARDDIARAYPDWGSQRGFSTTVSAGANADVCAYAIDDRGTAPNILLGCRRV
jgi:hypothetical protein